MQYSGLKAQGKKEVYEGDILSGQGKDCEGNYKEHRGVVVYRAPEYALKIITSPILKPGSLSTLIYCGEMEIIGNQHQHPELLATEGEKA